MGARLTRKIRMPKLALENASSVKVGIPLTARYPTGERVAQVAFWNEFGTARIPPRPFLRSAIARNKSAWIETARAALSRELNARAALELVGEKARGDIVMSITTLSTPPNTLATIARKGSSNPLINTAQMRNSFIAEVY